MDELEVRAWLASVFDVCERELRALDALQDPRLSDVLQALTALRAEIVSALAAVASPTSEQEPKHTE